MKVSELGEFGLIELLAKMIRDSKTDRLNAGQPLIGIGDDASAWEGDYSIQLATVDTMFQDIHFSAETATWKEIGWKSLAINISDIAAMGGVPEYILVALALPENSEVDDITELYEGMTDIARQYHIAIAGGNVSRAPQVSITATVIGKSIDKKILRRSAARSGDAVAVTGYPGIAAAGLEMLSNNFRFRPEVADYLRNAFLHPLPRVEEGQTLIKYGVTTAIDTSDGLAADLHHICEASRVRARVFLDRLPVHDAVRETFPQRFNEFAVSGGEDYELLFTAPQAVVERVQEQLRTKITVIGEISAGDSMQVEVVDAAGNTIKLDRPGWSHF